MNNVVKLFCLNLFFFVSLTSYSQTNPKNKNSEVKIFHHKPNLDTILNGYFNPIGYVNDYDHLFTVNQKYSLDSILFNYEKKSLVQIIMVTLDSEKVLSSEVDEVARVIFKGWKVGGIKNNGVLIAISKPFKRMRIENGKAVRVFFSDTETQFIIDTKFIPEFKMNNYYKGTLEGLKSLMETILINRDKNVKITF